MSLVIQDTRAGNIVTAKRQRALRVITAMATLDVQGAVLEGTKVKMVTQAVHAMHVQQDSTKIVTRKAAANHAHRKLRSSIIKSEDAHAFDYVSNNEQFSSTDYDDTTVGNTKIKMQEHHARIVRLGNIKIKMQEVAASIAPQDSTRTRTHAIRAKRAQLVNIRIATRPRDARIVALENFRTKIPKEIAKIAQRANFRTKTVKPVARHVAGVHSKTPMGRMDAEPAHWESTRTRTQGMAARTAMLENMVPRQAFHHPPALGLVRQVTFALQEAAVSDSRHALQILQVSNREHRTTAPQAPQAAGASAVARNRAQPNTLYRRDLPRPFVKERPPARVTVTVWLESGCRR